MFCAFHALGGTLVEPDSPASCPREGLRLALRRFKRTLLMVVSLSLSVDERVFFRPSKSRLCRLKDVGFSNHVSCISGVVGFNDQMRCHVLFGLLSLRMTITKKVKQAVNQDHLHLKPCKLSYRGVPAWLKLGQVSSEIPAVAGLACGAGITMFSWRRTNVLWLACSQCSIRTDVQQTTLFLRGKWATLKCEFCGVGSSTRKWLCVCGLPWHGCHIHAKAGFACRKPPRRSTGAQGNASKRDHGPSNCRPIPSLLALPPAKSARTVRTLGSASASQAERTPSTRASKRDAAGPSNCRPIPSLPAPVQRPPKRPLGVPAIGSRARNVSSRGASTRGRKRPPPPPHASDLEAVARLRDARLNPVPESSQIPALRREKSRGDATPPCGIIYPYRDPG